MRKFVGSIAILVFAVLILGWSRGWFSVSGSHQENESNINIKVNKDKFKDDADAARSKINELRNSEENEI